MISIPIIHRGKSSLSVNKSHSKYKIELLSSKNNAVMKNSRKLICVTKYPVVKMIMRIKNLTTGVSDISDTIHKHHALIRKIYYLFQISIL